MKPPPWPTGLHHAMPEGAPADLTELLAAIARHPSGAVPCRREDAETPLSAWTSDDPGEAATAALACASCPVLEMCREFGVEHARYGHGLVFGGLTDDTRYRERQRRARLQTSTTHHQQRGTTNMNENETTDAWGLEHSRQCAQPEPTVRRGEDESWNVLRCPQCGTQRLTRRGVIEQAAR